MSSLHVEFEFCIFDLYDALILDEDLSTMFECVIILEKMME